MARGDFIRQMPESARDFGRKPTLYERLHIDLPLLGILFALCVYGLVVLYSASGRQIDPVLRQGGFMAIGFAAMLAVEQLSPTSAMRRRSSSTLMATSSSRSTSTRRARFTAA